MMNNMTHAVCAECGEEFDYVLKPGFPRKYCATCKEIKDQEYKAREAGGVNQSIKENVPVVKPGFPVPTIGERAGVVAKPVTRTMPKDPVGLAVEVFIAMNKGENEGVFMTRSIELVKQAQEAFK